MKSKIYSIVISLSICAFALIPAGILPATFQNVLAQQDGNSSSNDTNMSSLEEDR
jgi:hypothetical protein